MKNRITPWILLAIFSCSRDNATDIKPREEGFTVIEYTAVAVEKTYMTPTFVHYMPWFESPEFAEYPNTQMGNWGYHWTMATKNPENIVNGKREIASHYYPLIGPYDNGEPDYCEYAVVCMKLAGLDGVLIDYPGITEVHDWKLLHEHTLAIITYLKKAGLKFGIVYEDSSLKNAFDQSIISDKVEEGKRVLSYMNEKLFSEPHYIRFENKPVLLNFGPQAIFSDEAWSQIFSEIPDINFLPLAFHGDYFGLTKSANGAFAWVSETTDDGFYNYCSGFDYCIGGAMPEFKDYYLEGGWGNGYTDYPARGNQLFEETLERACAHKPDALQIITWNDFGEGTIIEPTLEFGYERLEHLQQFLGVKYSAQDLSLAVKLYQKRKEYKGQISENNKLDQVFFYLISLQLEKARSLLDEL